MTIFVELAMRVDLMITYNIVKMREKQNGYDSIESQNI